MCKLAPTLVSQKKHSNRRAGFVQRFGVAEIKAQENLSMRAPMIDLD